MDRQAFKQRMQNLKSYRENNPGKGYWDWKVEAFQDGGQTGDPEKERFYQATGRSSNSDPIKKMFKQHKNINAYTKWFNAIPLLGTTALGANAYFNNNKNE